MVPRQRLPAFLARMMKTACATSSASCVLPRRRINQVHVPPDQCGKRRLGTIRGKVPHQIHVIGVHLPHYVRRSGKSGHEFSMDEVMWRGLARNESQRVGNDGGR
jgi:hypothetical protein